MVILNRIYTRTGDDGTTGLFYGGRVSKDDPGPAAYGAVDEAVSALGLARAPEATHAALLRADLMAPGLLHTGDGLEGYHSAQASIAIGSASIRAHFR